MEAGDIIRLKETTLTRSTMSRKITEKIPEGKEAAFWERLDEEKSIVVVRFSDDKVYTGTVPNSSIIQ